MPVKVFAVKPALLMFREVMFDFMAIIVRLRSVTFKANDEFRLAILACALLKFSMVDRFNEEMFALSAITLRLRSVMFKANDEFRLAILACALLKFSMVDRFNEDIFACNVVFNPVNCTVVAKPVMLMFSDDMFAIRFTMLMFNDEILAMSAMILILTEERFAIRLTMLLFNDEILAFRVVLSDAPIVPVPLVARLMFKDEMFAIVELRDRFSDVRFACRLVLSPVS